MIFWEDLALFFFVFLCSTQLGKISKCIGLCFVFLLILRKTQAESVAVITWSIQYRLNFSHNIQPCNDKIHLC